MVIATGAPLVCISDSSAILTLFGDNTIGIGIPDDYQTSNLAVSYVYNLNPSHEVLHTAGREHTNYCAQRYPLYPVNHVGCPPESGSGYHKPADGTISQEKDQHNDNAYFGFDIRTEKISGPDTPDVMSYYLGSSWPSLGPTLNTWRSLVGPSGTSGLSLSV